MDTNDVGLVKHLSLSLACLDLDVGDITWDAGLLLEATFVATGEVELEECPFPGHEAPDTR